MRTSTKTFAEEHKGYIINAIEDKLKRGQTTVYFHSKLDPSILNCVLEEYRSLGYHINKDITETSIYMAVLTFTIDRNKE